MEPDRIWDFLHKLSPRTRSSLLTELERLEMCGVDIPGAADIQAKLRAEFRKDGSTQTRVSPSRYFFEPLDGLLVDGAPEHANSGRLARTSLAPIWEWISQDLLPTMARDYTAEMKRLIAADEARAARKTAAAFQVKVVKSLENMLATPDGLAQSRAQLAVHTASPAAFGDVAKLMQVLRAREALTKFRDQLPPRIGKFDDALVQKITALLDAFRASHGEAVPFALALIGTRLKTPWELMRLATKPAASKKASDIATTPYALAVSMVLDQLEDRRLALLLALKHNRVVNARELLVQIYDTEYALQVRIDELDGSEWGARLRQVMEVIAALVEAEVARFPDEVGHVLDSRRLRSHNSLSGRLTYLAWKGRDAIHDSAAFCRKLMGQN